MREAGCLIYKPVPDCSLGWHYTLHSAELVTAVVDLALVEPTTVDLDDVANGVAGVVVAEGVVDVDVPGISFGKFVVPARLHSHQGMELGIAVHHHCIGSSPRSLLHWMAVVAAVVVANTVL